MTNLLQNGLFEVLREKFLVHPQVPTVMMMDKFKVIFYTLAALYAIFFDRPYLCVGVVIGEIIYEFLGPS